MAGWQALSRPSAAEGGGRRPAFTGLATQPYSATEVDGWNKLSRVSQNRAAVQSEVLSYLSAKAVADADMQLQVRHNRPSCSACGWRVILEHVQISFFGWPASTSK